MELAGITDYDIIMGKIQILLANGDFYKVREIIDQLEKDSKQEDLPTDVKQISIIDLNIDSRAVEAMNEYGLLIVDDLYRCSPEELLSLKFVGPKAIKQVRLALAKLGVEHD